MKKVNSELDLKLEMFDYFDADSSVLTSPDTIHIQGSEYNLSGHLKWALSRPATKLTLGASRKLYEASPKLWEDLKTRQTPDYLNEMADKLFAISGNTCVGILGKADQGSFEELLQSLILDDYDATSMWIDKVDFNWEAKIFKATDSGFTKGLLVHIRFPETLLTIYPMTVQVDCGVPVGMVVNPTPSVNAQITRALVGMLDFEAILENAVELSEADRIKVNTTTASIAEAVQFLGGWENLPKPIEAVIAEIEPVGVLARRPIKCLATLLTKVTFGDIIRELLTRARMNQEVNVSLVQPLTEMAKLALRSKSAYYQLTS